MAIKIDAHHHFWKYDPIRDSWINEQMQAIQRDFLPEDLKPVLQKHGFTGCVVVQSDQSEEENAFQLVNASENDFVKGLIGWADLRSADIEDRLAYYCQFPKMKGFRHVLQGEADRALMLQQDFMRGIAALEQFGFTYDLLIFPDQIRFCTQLARAFPNQIFVLDHIAKPDILNSKIEPWRQDIIALAACDNVYCKVSGMVTEASWNTWEIADFYPYLDVVFEAFGPSRLMYGSDWPVCEVAGGYDRMIEIVKTYTDHLNAAEHDMFWGENAIRCYKLE